MNESDFQELVIEAIKEVPQDFLKFLENVEITTAMWPNLDQRRFARGALLFGLYEGIPKTKRGINYTMVLPDKITIFQGPIELVAKTPEDVKKQVKKTVIHEIAHHFGISDKRLKQIGS